MALAERGYVLRLDRLEFLAVQAAVLGRLQAELVGDHERVALEVVASDMEREALRR